MAVLTLEPSDTEPVGTGLDVSLDDGVRCLGLAGRFVEGIPRQGNSEQGSPEQ